MTEITEAVEREQAGPGPLEVIGDNEWQALLNKDDRNSPEEYPEMVLITRAELGGAMCEAYILAKDQTASEITRLQEEAYKEGWNDREDDLIAGVNRIAPEEASQGAGEPVAFLIKDPEGCDDRLDWPTVGEQPPLSVRDYEEGYTAEPLFTSPPTDPRTKALEEAINKAIRILSDHKLGEPRRVLDARDVLIMSRSDSPVQAEKGDDHG